MMEPGTNGSQERIAVFRSLRPWVKWLFSGPLLSPIVSFVAAAVVAVSPWVVTVIALLVVSATMTPILGYAAIEDLRLAVVYAFALSLLPTAPIATLAARLVRASVDEDQGRRVPELYAFSLVLAAAASQLVAVTFAALLGGMSLELAVAFVSLSVCASLLWTDFAVLSALRAFGRLIGSFALGMLLAIVSAMLSTTSGAASVAMILWSFSIGIVFAHFLMSGHIVRIADLQLPNLLEAARRVMREAREQVVLFGGILLAVVGVWVDKLVFWLSPVGMTSASSFRHFAPYDSALFIAHLSVIPTFTAILLLSERVAVPRIRAFWQLLKTGPTYRAMAEKADALFNEILTAVFRILFVQAAFSALFVLFSAHLVVALSMEMRQLEWLRIGIVATLLQSFLFANCFVIMLCNRVIKFFQLQLVFCLTNLIVGALAYIWFGVSAYGVFVASLVSSLVSFIFAYDALKNFLFISFVQENAELYASRVDGPSLTGKG